jgi:hypothetical protein
MKKHALIIGALVLAALAFFFTRGGKSKSTSTTITNETTDLPNNDMAGTPGAGTSTTTTPPPPDRYAGYLVSDLTSASEHDYETFVQRTVKKYGRPPTKKEEEAWRKRWLKGYARDHTPDFGDPNTPPPPTPVTPATPEPEGH